MELKVHRYIKILTRYISDMARRCVPMFSGRYPSDAQSRDHGPCSVIYLVAGQLSGWITGFLTLSVRSIFYR
jgi:hypothetical protein